MERENYVKAVRCSAAYPMKNPTQYVDSLHTKSEQDNGKYMGEYIYKGEKTLFPFS